MRAEVEAWRRPARAGRVPPGGPPFHAPYGGKHVAAGRHSPLLRCYEHVQPPVASLRPLPASEG
jgi:hypothetical protein